MFQIHKSKNKYIHIAVGRSAELSESCVLQVVALVLRVLRQSCRANLHSHQSLIINHESCIVGREQTGHHGIRKTTLYVRGEYFSLRDDGRLRDNLILPKISRRGSIGIVDGPIARIVDASGMAIEVYHTNRLKSLSRRNLAVIVGGRYNW